MLGSISNLLVKLFRLTAGPSVIRAARRRAGLPENGHARPGQPCDDAQWQCLFSAACTVLCLGGNETTLHGSPRQTPGDRVAQETTLTPPEYPDEDLRFLQTAFDDIDSALNEYESLLRSAKAGEIGILQVLQDALGDVGTALDENEAVLNVTIANWQADEHQEPQPCVR